MPPASWAHISAYWASVTAIAGVFWPEEVGGDQVGQQHSVGRDHRRGHRHRECGLKGGRGHLGLAGGLLGRAAIVLSQATYGVTAASIARDEGPIQGALVSSEITEP